MEELDLFLPPWVDALGADHPIRQDIWQAVREAMGELRRVRDVDRVVEAIGACPRLTAATVTSKRLGDGVCAARLELPRSLFYETLSGQTGFEIPDDGALFRLLADLGKQRTEYQRVAVGAGAICVLTDNGAVAHTVGEAGTFRFQDEGGTNYFGFAKSDSYTIGCSTDGITVSGNLVTLRYDVIMGGLDEKYQGYIENPDQ